MKCPVKLIKNEKVGQTIINEFCVKFFVRRGSTTKYENISVTSSTASLSLHASKKDNWRFSLSFFFFYLEVTFNSMILNLIKISRVLNLVCDSGETIFYGVLFSRFQKANMKKGHSISRLRRFKLHFNFQHVNFWRPHEIYPKEFLRIKRAIKMKIRAGFSAPYAKSLQMNVISQQKTKSRSYQYMRPVNDLCIC